VESNPLEAVKYLLEEGEGVLHALVVDADGRINCHVAAGHSVDTLLFAASYLLELARVTALEDGAPSTAPIEEALAALDDAGFAVSSVAKAMH